MTFTIHWERSQASCTEAARFFAKTISLDPAYISHGEIQTGLSVDGKTWISDLEARFLDDLSELDEDRSLAILRDSRGTMLAAAIVLFVHNNKASFAVLEDLTVDPSVRSKGIGTKMIEFVDAEARGRDCRWVFLESGKKNHGAHRFFEAHGYAPLSTVFGKQLS